MESEGQGSWGARPTVIDPARESGNCLHDLLSVGAFCMPVMRKLSVSSATEARVRAFTWRVSVANLESYED
mgnify:CR=1 FL=1